MAQRKLDSHYQFLIVGGGIVGAGIFRDLALHGQNVLLIDAHDYSAQTSQASSKMLHGGIRYLENFDFSLVEEALHEKNIWLKQAPSITRERAFFLPNYKSSKYPLWMLKIGLFTYDLLSHFQNSHYKILNKEETLKALPGLNAQGLNGAGVYFDGIVDDSKLALECIYDGQLEKNAHAENYLEIIEIEKSNPFYKIKLKNNLTHEIINLTSEFVIFATGPFTDQLMHKLQIPWEDKLLPSKGSHLWLKKDSLQIINPIVMQTKDNRVVFVIPQRESILVGTTEIPLKKDENFFNIQCSHDEIEYILKLLNEYFPDANVNSEDILSHFSGVRPLVQDGHDSSKTSRNHQIFNPLTNCYAIVGGKYTTFRKMAQDICKVLMKKINETYNPNLTLNSLRKPSYINNAHNIKIEKEVIKKIISEEQPKSFEDLLVRRLSIPSEEHWLNELTSLEEIKSFYNQD
jgi:glycerol-3-phosphate dehydrogenase